MATMMMATTTMMATMAMAVMMMVVMMMIRAVGADVAVLQIRGRTLTLLVMIICGTQVSGANTLCIS